MELKQVHKYIDRYLVGETSLEEENVLEAYFSQPNIDETLFYLKPYFTAIAQQRKQRFTVSFNPVKRTKIISLKRFTAVAAASIVGVFVWQQTFVPQQPSPEEIAFEAFKTNMYLVAEQLNKGKQGVAYIDTFNETTNKYLKTE